MKILGLDVPPELQNIFKDLVSVDSTGTLAGCSCQLASIFLSSSNWARARTSSLSFWRSGSGARSAAGACFCP